MHCAKGLYSQQRKQEQEEVQKQPGEGPRKRSKTRQTGAVGMQRRQQPGTEEHSQPAWRPYASTCVRRNDDADRAMYMFYDKNDQLSSP